MNGHEIDVWIESGRRHAQSWGSAGDPLVLCAPGLTTNMHSFDALGPELVGLARDVVAVDLGVVTASGRRSPRTPALRP